MPPEFKFLQAQDTADFIALLQVFAEVFEMENFQAPGADHLQRLLSKPDFQVLVAKMGTSVIGGITMHTLDQYYNTKPQAYIYDLGVLPKFQRQGIGQKLVAILCDYCREQGYEQAFVQADKEDGHALEFYRSAGASTEAEVVHFSFLL